MYSIVDYLVDIVDNTLMMATELIWMPTLRIHLEPTTLIDFVALASVLCAAAADVCDVFVVDVVDYLDKNIYLDFAILVVG